VRIFSPLVRAVTFLAVAPISDLRPRDDYLEHYRRGIVEHALPDDYLAALLDAAQR
jgi:hypothetical protein